MSSFSELIKMAHNTGCPPLTDHQALSSRESWLANGEWTMAGDEFLKLKQFPQPLDPHLSLLLTDHRPLTTDHFPPVPLLQQMS